MLIFSLLFFSVALLAFGTASLAGYIFFEKFWHFAAVYTFLHAGYVLSFLKLFGVI